MASKLPSLTWAWLPLCCALHSLPAMAAPDPLNARACQDAIARLDQAEAVRPPALEALRSARSQVARQCLRERLDAPADAVRRTPMPLPPLRVLSPGGLGAAQPVLVAPPVLPSPALANRPLTSITQCDAQGCWASDGSRLQRLGPNLVGPKGVCSVQGSVVACPP